MKPARFEYFRPTGIDEALQLLSRFGGEARIIAGGQSLVPMMNLRIVKPSALIDVNEIVELAGITVAAGHIRLGAMVRQAQLITDPLIGTHAPLLAKAASHIGHMQTRSRGTLGGSIAHADPSAEISLVMVTLDATFTVRSKKGDRQIAARDFFIDAMTTAANDEEMLTEIHVPISPVGARTSFREFARRHGDFAIASAAIQYNPEDKRVLAGIGAVGPMPWFCPLLSDQLSAEGLDPERTMAAVEAELKEIEPNVDLNAGADYRRDLAKSLLTECVREVFST